MPKLEQPPATPNSPELAAYLAPLTPRQERSRADSDSLLDENFGKYHKRKPIFCICLLIRGGFALQIYDNYMNIAIKQVNRHCDMGLWEMLFQKTSTIAQ